MKIVEFQNIHRAYERGVDVLDGVSFDIHASEIVGLLGKNGAGKTTLMRIAMGMIMAQRGTVRLFDLDPRREPVEIKRRIGYVSEEQILPPFLRVEGVLAIHRRLFPTWDDELAKSLAQRFGLPPRAKIKTLSKGQARQVALLCAVAHRPELLLLDEPAGGLDPAARREFLETSIQLLNEAGTTILFSSHYMTDVERMADRIVMLHKGQVLIDQPLHELRESFSLALIEPGAETTREQLLAFKECLAARDHGGGLRAIFRLDAREATRILKKRAGVAECHCTPIDLEEMFIELTGGQS